MSARWLLVVSAALLYGCGSTGSIETPNLELAPPDHFEHSASEEPANEPAKALEDLGDQVLVELIREALSNNPSLGIASANVDRALAAARIEGAALVPQASAGLNGSRRKQNFIGFPIPGSADSILSTTSSNYGLSLNVSWEVDLWGRLRAAKASAYADAAAAQEDLDAARLSIAAQTARAWLLLLEANRQVELAERTLESRLRGERSMQRRYAGGLVSALELRLARTQTASVEAQLANRQEQRDASTRALEILLGRYPEAELTASGDLPPVPTRLDAGVPADLLSRRPDLRALERRAFAASADLRSARRARYPSFSLTGSTGTASDSLGDLLDGDFSVWSLAAGLLQPIFQGGRLRAGVSFADAGVDAAVASWLQATLSAFFEVERALAAQATIEARVAALERAATESRAAEELALDRYRNGLTDYLNVLESQRTSFTSDSLLLSARREQLDNRVDLILALGGRIGPEDASSVSASSPSANSD